MISSSLKGLSASYNKILNATYKSPAFFLSNQIIKNFSKSYKIISDPKDVSKLIFDDEGKCKIFEHKNGEYQLKWIVRVISSLTVLNSVLTGLEFSYPSILILYLVFGTWNQFSFSIFAGLGYLSIFILNVLSKRTIHRISLCKDLQTVDV